VIEFRLWAALLLVTACRESGAKSLERGVVDANAPVTAFGIGDGFVAIQPGRPMPMDATVGSTSLPTGCPSSTTAPIVLTTVSDAGALNDLFVDTRGAYFAEGSLRFSTASSLQYSVGTIRRAPLGGGPATVLWSGQEFPQSVVASDTSVYFAAADRGTATRDAEIYELALGGGSPTQLASWSADGTATALAYSDGQVCWSYTSGTGGSVACKADDSPMATSTSALPSAGVLALNSADVFWPSEGAVYAMARFDSSQRSRRVWNNPSPFNWLAPVPGEQSVLASDDSTIYRFSLGTMSASIILHPASTPASVASDGQFVYWTESASGTVAAAPLNGGAEVSLVSGQKCPTKISVFNGSLYWLDVVSKQVLKTPACSR
jgi:hypothetical protein